MSFAVVISGRLRLGLLPSLLDSGVVGPLLSTRRFARLDLLMSTMGASMSDSTLAVLDMVVSGVALLVRQTARLSALPSILGVVGFESPMLSRCSACFGKLLLVFGIVCSVPAMFAFDSDNIGSSLLLQVRSCVGLLPASIGGAWPGVLMATLNRFKLDATFVSQSFTHLSPSLSLFGSARVGLSVPILNATILSPLLTLRIVLYPEAPSPVFSIPQLEVMAFPFDATRVNTSAVLRSFVCPGLLLFTFGIGCCRCSLVVLGSTTSGTPPVSRVSARLEPIVSILSSVCFDTSPLAPDINEPGSSSPFKLSPCSGLVLPISGGSRSSVVLSAFADVQLAPSPLVQSSVQLFASLSVFGRGCLNASPVIADVMHVGISSTSKCFSRAGVPLLTASVARLGISLLVSGLSALDLSITPKIHARMEPLLISIGAMRPSTSTPVPDHASLDAFTPLHSHAYSSLPLPLPYCAQLKSLLSALDSPELGTSMASRCPAWSDAMALVFGRHCIGPLALMLDFCHGGMLSTSQESARSSLMASSASTSRIGATPLMPDSIHAGSVVALRGISRSGIAVLAPACVRLGFLLSLHVFPKAGASLLIFGIVYVRLQLAASDLFSHDFPISLRSTACSGAALSIYGSVRFGMSKFALNLALLSSLVIAQTIAHSEAPLLVCAGVGFSFTALLLNLANAGIASLSQSCAYSNSSLTVYSSAHIGECPFALDVASARSLVIVRGFC